MNHPRSRLVRTEFASSAVGDTVEYRVLLPPDWVRSEPVPLIVHLHGAMSSSASLELARPFYDELWADGDIPRAIVACPSTPTVGGFYINGPRQAWETMISEEFPQHVAVVYGHADVVAMLGASMGGYGALKAAFSTPDRFAAVAAISPAVFPGETPDDVPSRNIPSVLGELHRAMSEATGDPAVYASNSVYGRARTHADEIRDASLPLLVDCGALDEFLLHEGAEYLHRVLDELDIAHEYRLVTGAGHLGPAADERTRDAIRFIGSALDERE
ncbi:S-formylglutathione hydrolase [Rhodococcus sp. SMB37]|uniref:alpha/beta hydrolase n=1 Tax=Rhodococcus sp. SMB37 TaxID=2512213 RepID=UPI0006D25F39|nr:alpha/beta hydrolase-fold protein [Rhodococcus sp. SMB37]TCN48162.1 S-formylglutathione hydrolase [Rhodococcus sp. SMB37]